MSSIYDLVVMSQSWAGFPKNWQTFEIAVSYQSIILIHLSFFFWELVQVDFLISFMNVKNWQGHFLFIYFFI